MRTTSTPWFLRGEITLADQFILDLESASLGAPPACAIREIDAAARPLGRLKLEPWMTIRSLIQPSL
jgi:hypothetical protein